MPTQRTHKITMCGPHIALYKICMIGSFIDIYGIDHFKHFRSCIIEMFYTLSGCDPDFIEEFENKILPNLWSPPNDSLQKLECLLKEINVELELK